MFRLLVPSQGKGEITRVDQNVLGSEVGLIAAQIIFLKHSSEDVPNRAVNGIAYKRDMGD